MSDEETRERRLKRRNRIARDLKESKVFKIRIVGSKKKKDRKLTTNEIVNHLYNEELINEYTDFDEDIDRAYMNEELSSQDIEEWINSLNKDDDDYD